VIPDDSLQPTESGASQLRWKLTNLVSDRRLAVLIPSAQTPLARTLLLMKLVAVGVLLFGAGFWFLSEQFRPGQLDTFRLGHFLLLALNYSLFFVIFGVLAFEGRLGTRVCMAVSALFSLPLLALHATRVLNARFALTRVLPLTLFTLALVINGVYGGRYRDYLFIAAAIFVIGYVTLSYKSWAAGRDKYRQEQEAAYALRRRALVDEVTAELGARMTELSAAATLAGEQIKSGAGPGLAAARSRLEQALGPVEGLRKEYDELTKRMPSLAARPFTPFDDHLKEVGRTATAFRDRLEPHLARLRAELAAVRESLKPSASVSDGQVHCAACGRVTAAASFCQHCGAARAAEKTCPECRQQILIPIHLLPHESKAAALFCTHCGARLPSATNPSA
jgi:hypothetical protein